MKVGLQIKNVLDYERTHNRSEKEISQKRLKDISDLPLDLAV